MQGLENINWEKFPVGIGHSNGVNFGRILVERIR